MIGSTVFMFSGQGSQYFQMGRGLYGENATFRQWMQDLDEIARPIAGTSIVEAIYAEGRTKGDSFDRTLLTHPAIFMVEYALARTLVESGLRPDVVLGVSLGSFTAAAVAEALSVEDALTSVIRQALVLEQHCDRGGMLAILAAPALFDEPFLRDSTELAAINFDSHFVVSAPNESLGEIEGILRRRGIGHQRLPVSFAFHSEWIAGARAPFASVMQSVQTQAPGIPMACCERAGFVDDLSGDYFWNVLRRPMRFREMVAALDGAGARRYVDVGPAGTLATFLRYGILSAGSASSAHAILTPFGSDSKNLASLLSGSRPVPGRQAGDGFAASRVQA